MPRQIDIEQIKDKLGIGEDKIYAAMGSFETPEALVKAGRKVREMGYTKLDAMTPFPVHGIDAALGIRYSKLGWIVVCFSLTGLTTALLLQWYTGGTQPIKALIPFGLASYPLVIGGKPLFDFSFSIPVDFELTIAFTALATFFGMWIMNGLPRLYHPSMNYRSMHRATDDRFLLLIESDDPMFDAQLASEHLKSVGAEEVEVVVG
jgi:hypothetical protein